MKLILLDAATLGEGLDFQKLRQFGELTIYQNTKPEEAPQRLLDADVAIVNKIKLGADNLQGAAHLKLICEFATGYDNIDLDICRARGIGVCNVRGYSTHSVAQLTVLMALTLLEKLGAYTEAIQAGVYQQSGVANLLSPVYHELCGKTWGIGRRGRNRQAGSKSCRSIRLPCARFYPHAVRNALLRSAKHAFIRVRRRFSAHPAKRRNARADRRA